MRSRTPLTAIALASVLVALSSPASALGGHWWIYPPGSGHIVHHDVGHNPSLTFYNKTVATNTGLEHARGEWSTSPYFDLVNWASDSAHVVAWEGNWGNTGWAAQAVPVVWATGVAPSVDLNNGHVNQMWIQMNTSVLYGVGTTDYKVHRAVGCHEIGHAIGGMWEGTGEGGPGCMNYGYVFGFDANVAAWRSPNAHDFAHPAHLWNGLH